MSKFSLILGLGSWIIKFIEKKKEVELKLSQIKEFLVNHLVKSIIPKITNNI